MNRILRRSLSFVFALGWALRAVAAEDTDAIIQSLRPFQQQADPRAVDRVWPYLDSPEASVRAAAGQVLLAQPFAQWKERALEEKSTWASLTALRALAEACPPKDAEALSPHLCEHLTTLRLEEMDEAQLSAAMQLNRLILTRLGPVSEDERQQMIDLWSRLQPNLPTKPQTEAKTLLEFLNRAPVRKP